MVVNWNVEGGRAIRTDGHHFLIPLQVPRSTTSALFHSRACKHARRSGEMGGGEHCGTPFFLPFNRSSTLDLMHPQHHHATVHQTSSCAKGKRPRERGEGEGDGWTPGEMLRIPKKVLAGMFRVMQAVAVHGVVPPTRVGLIPKTAHPLRNQH